MTLDLTSPVFTEGAKIPTKYTCEGADVSPPLEWSAVPDGTAALALFCSDPDAPGGTWRHWAIYDIPPDRRGLTRGETGFPDGITDFGRPGYGGPCPPPGHGPHRYVFRLVALSAAIGVPGGTASCAALEAQAAKLEIAAAELVGTYERA